MFLVWREAEIECGRWGGVGGGGAGRVGNKANVYLWFCL